MLTTIDQDFINNLPRPPEGRSKAEYRASNLPVGFRIETRVSSNGVGTFRLRHKGKDIRIGRSNDMPLDQAVAIALAHRNEKPKGEDISVLTLSEFYHLHFKPYALPRLRTWRTYDSIFHTRLESRFGKRPLDSLTVYELEQFQTDLLNEKLSPSHAVGHVKLILRMLNLAVKWKFIDKNPCEGVEMLKFDNRKERYLTKDEQDRLVKAASNDKSRQTGLLIVFLLNTGMRSGAARELKWEWLSLEDKLITVPASVSKNKKPNTVHLNDTAVEILNRVKRPRDNPYVFVNLNTGKPLVNIFKAFKRVLLAAGLPKSVRIHDLRHTFCHNLVSANHSLATVKELVNHANYETTLRYANIAPFRLREAIQSSATSKDSLNDFNLQT